MMTLFKGPVGQRPDNIAGQGLQKSRISAFEKNYAESLPNDSKNGRSIKMFNNATYKKVMKQITNNIMMIKPLGFTYNEQTATNNYYQQILDNLTDEEKRCSIKNQLF